jgi:hypothetical protein
LPEVTNTPVTQELAVTPTKETDTTTNTTTNDYQDGAYEADVTYLTPARSEYLLDVSLTLTKDVVTGVNITYSQGAEKDPNAAKFEAVYKTQVIGKDIDTLNLSRIGGASLTTGAFNNALATIKTNAKS